ncbi:MAG TPA: hypothetical protein VIM55_08875 [Mucilaginibacter sp.]
MNATENISRKKRLIVWLSLVIAFLIALFFKIYPSSVNDYFTSGKFVKDLGSDLSSALLTLLTFGLIYQVYTEKENREIAKKDIIDALQADAGTLALLSENTRMAFIKNTVCSIIGEKYGSLLYSNVIERYIEETTSWRENLVYNVEFNKADEDFSFKGIPEMRQENYYSQEESLTYTKHFKKGTKNIPFRVVFAFNDKDLDHLMGDKFIFFRGIIQVDGFEEAVEEYVPQDFKDFMEKCLNLRFTFFNANENPVLGGSASISDFCNITYINDEVKRIEITLKDELLKEILMEDGDSVHYHCKMTFKMPFSKKNTKFHLALPEPTLNPTMKLRFDKSIKNIDYFTIFSNSSKKLKFTKEGSTYTISTPEIIYPRSGAIFFWSI